MCGGGNPFKSIGKSISKGFKSVTKGVSKVVKGVGGVLKSPLVGGILGGTAGFFLGGPMGALQGAALGFGASSMLGAGKQEVPELDVTIPNAPIPAPESIAPTGTGALVEVGALSDELRSGGSKRGSGKRTASSGVAGLGAGGLRL